ncbi:MAG: radical SAM protein [Chloroflexi bacterium]|nr:radical SAM protein [Chloroflexota bacterium]
MNSVIYGPVSSWRLGRSLGIDLLSTEGNTCSFDCVYCQLGKTANPLVERRQFVSTEKLTTALEKGRGIAADYATFSGMGEPTLASNLGQAIQLARSILRLPVAILTNSSLMPREDVRHELAQADVVVAKVDAPTEELFRQINRPYVGYALDDILQAIKLFRMDYRGKLALQMMFIEVNRGYAADMARVAKELSPDEVQINTPLRPCPVKPLTPEEIDAIRHEFSGLGQLVTVYESPRPYITPLSLRETLRRRPKL